MSSCHAVNTGIM